ncbi:MAG: rRNA maturation RNase YbeY [Acidobacteria bacterium]|nr:rRNA maturation RNase YbeY [Acidobacteriota bacterium]MBV9067732.1 rRNA maturation RNase YbeY [Acidobacteriota bacterium]MBV9185789.1 rRNA maturation RNase YbeY [Acidobacteriota bacterium]
MTNVEVTGPAVPRFSRREIAEFARRVLIALRVDDDIHEVSIAIVDDDAMRTLNRKFRKKNKTTDVLTFPADDSDADPNAKGRPLGDIVISIDQARRQATDQKHSLATEVRYLILHGILHALGYDHETDAGEMNALEVDVRSVVGLE